MSTAPDGPAAANGYDDFAEAYAAESNLVNAHRRVPGGGDQRTRPGPGRPRPVPRRARGHTLGASLCFLFFVLD
ncbi:hypothetical protein, partial [Pseudonocardia oceani]